MTLDLHLGEMDGGGGGSTRAVRFNFQSTYINHAMREEFGGEASRAVLACFSPRILGES